MGKYHNCTDTDIIAALTGDKPNEGLVNYFFFDLCKEILTRISKSMSHDDNYKTIIGEFYVYLSKNNWNVLRQFQGRNNATLLYYLSYCANNHFAELNRIKEIFIEDCQYEFADIYDEMDEEKELLCKAVSKAFTMLSEYHQKTLELLVINEMSSLDAADILWQYTRHKNIDWRTLPVKKVQDTLAKGKQRACANLMNKTTELLATLRQ